MENISRGPTFGDYGCKTTDSPLPPLLNVMYCVRVSLRTAKIFLTQPKEKEVLGKLYISLYKSVYVYSLQI